MFTYFPTVCPVNNANVPANQTQPHISLPGCVQTGQTLCCGSDQTQGQTYFPSLGHCAAQAQSPVSLLGCVQTGQTLCCGSDQTQGQTYFPSLGHCAAQGQTYFPSLGHCAAQAQFPTLSMKCIGITTRVLTQVVGCGGQAQAQTYFPSIGSCAAAQIPPITIPQDCGVSWNCNQGTAPAQAQFPTLSMNCIVITTRVLTQVVGCGGQAQAQTYFPSIGSC